MSNSHQSKKCNMQFLSHRPQKKNHFTKKISIVIRHFAILLKSFINIQ